MVWSNSFSTNSVFVLKTDDSIFMLVFAQIKGTNSMVCHLELHLSQDSALWMPVNLWEVLLPSLYFMIFICYSDPSLMLLTEAVVKQKLETRSTSIENSKLVIG